MRNISCTTVSSCEEIAERVSVDLDAALDVFDQYPWQQEVDRFFGDDDAVCAPCVWYWSKEDNDSYLVITGMEDGSFSMMMKIVLKPGFLGLFQKRASRDITGVSRDDARKVVEQFCSLDLGSLYHEVKGTD